MQGKNLPQKRDSCRILVWLNIEYFHLEVTYNTLVLQIYANYTNVFFHHMSSTD